MLEEYSLEKSHEKRYCYYISYFAAKKEANSIIIWSSRKARSGQWFVSLSDYLRPLHRCDSIAIMMCKRLKEEEKVDHD